MVFLECELIEKESQDSLETFGGSKKVVLPADLDLFPKGQPHREEQGPPSGTDFAEIPWRSVNTQS